MVVFAQAAEAAGPGAAEAWVFILAGAVALGSAVAMVIMRNAVHAALMLVVNFLAIAVLYAALEAQFLAVVQVIVYAGAIMVLFLFVIMLLGVARDEPSGGRVPAQRPVAILVGLLLFGTIAASAVAPFLGPASVCGAEQAAGEGIRCAGLADVNREGNVRAVGGPLFTDYVWPFEVTSALLVIAAIGAMVLGRRRDRPEDLVDHWVVDDHDGPAGGGEAQAAEPPRADPSPRDPAELHAAVREERTR